MEEELGKRLLNRVPTERNPPKWRKNVYLLPMEGRTPLRPQSFVSSSEGVMEAQWHVLL